MASATLPKVLYPVNTPRVVRIPDEGDKHESTWMALAHSTGIWSKELLPGVRSDLIQLANTISEYEPVRMLIRQGDREFAKSKVSKNVELVTAEFNDLWIRDYGPQFLLDSTNKLHGLDLNFNGWGKKQAFAEDAKIASFIANQLGISLTKSKVTMEGGAIEVNGKGTMIATKSCIINKNRNPYTTISEIEKHLKTQFGLKEIIWLPGIAGKDITDGHTDFYARFLPNGQVLANLEEDKSSFDYNVTRSHLKILQSKYGQDNVLTVAPPADIPGAFAGHDFAAGYINYYLVNGGVIMPKFGDKEADEIAKETLQSGYPDREIKMVQINSISAGGGGIHCSTLHQPAQT
jgi:agmatine deiminase